MAHYTYLDAEQLIIPEGTQQVPALMAALNKFKKEGGTPIHIGGDLEDEFQIILEWPENNG